MILKEALQLIAEMPPNFKVAWFDNGNNLPGLLSQMKNKNNILAPLELDAFLEFDPNHCAIVAATDAKLVFIRSISDSALKKLRRRSLTPIIKVED